MSTPTAAPEPVTEVAPELPVTVTDAEGAELVVEDVSRLVVLNGNITEIVFALGLGDHVVGVDVTSTYPPEAQDLPEVGVQIQLNAEGIIALQPTLVLGNTFAGPPEVIKQVRGAGIPVLILPDYDTLDSIGTKIRGIAAALGVPRRSEQLAAESAASIDEAMALVEGVESRPRVAFLYLRGTQFQLIGGVGSGATSLIEAAGGIDVGVEIGIRGFMQITPEALVTANPDVILIFTSGLTAIGGVEGLLQVPGVAQTGAGRTGTIVDFDGQYLFAYGAPNVQWAFGAALLLAAGMALGKGMSLKDLISGFHDGIKGVVLGSVILLLAITIGNVSTQTGGGVFLVEQLGDAVPYFLLPVMLQLMTMVIAFSTGTSWGTYAVAFPLAMPLAWAVAGAQGLSHPELFMTLCFASVMDGSVYGDQCSPISDTTVLSSVCTGCDLMDHVKTQIPQASVAAALAAVCWTVIAFFTA